MKFKNVEQALVYAIGQVTLRAHFAATILNEAREAHSAEPDHPDSPSANDLRRLEQKSETEIAMLKTLRETFEELAAYDNNDKE